MKSRPGAAFVAAGLLLAACGGGATTDEIASLETTGVPVSETTEAAAGLSMEDGLIAFTECLREEGVEIDDPTVGPDGNLQMGPIVIGGETGPGDDMDAVMRGMDDVFAKCEPLLGEVMFTGDELPDFNEFEDQLLEYAACMRDNGVDMADPDLSGAGGMIEMMIDPTDPVFEAADQECRGILAGFGPMG